jgi:small subunit ribosomal protein S10
MAKQPQQASKPAAKPAVAQKAAAPKFRVRIKLQSYDHRLIDASTAKIVDVARGSQANVVGPIPLPTERKLFCVLRSPHVDKKSREHFEMRIHKRLIDIVEPAPDLVAQLSKLDLPAGVDIEVKL